MIKERWDLPIYGLAILLVLLQEEHGGLLMDITIHLPDEQARQLAYIQEHSQQDAAELMGQAIEQRYQQLCHSIPDADPLKKLRNSAFIGSFKGAADLASRSEEFFYEVMDKKYDHR